MNRAAPFCPKSARNVRQCVHPNRVKTIHFHPPQRILNQIFFNFRVVLIKIGQNVNKPAFDVSFLRLISCSRIHRRPFLPIIVRMILQSPVPPRRSRRIVYPNVIWSCVIRHLILNYFNSQRMRLFNKFAQFRHISQMLVNRIHIRRTVAMITRRRFAVINFLKIEFVVVVINGRCPNRCDA